MFAAVPREVAGELGAETLHLGEALAVKVTFLSSSPELNHALGVSTSEQLDALPAFFVDGRHAVSPAPGADLDAPLRERGYEPGYAWMKFARGVDGMPETETDLELTEVGPDRGRDFARAVVDG